MSLRSALYTGSIIHRRLRPRPHRLRYRVFWMLLDLDEIDELSDRLFLFSHNRPNLVSFHEADHGNGSARRLRLQIDDLLAAAGFDPADGTVELLCMPRIFGYGFNPLSIYFCRNSRGELTAILYEVHNTFGERHTYLMPANAHASGVEQACRKVFYVSPFIDMDMTYSFRLRAPDECVTLAIRTADGDGPLLLAALSGRRRSLSNGSLLGVLAAYPLLTLKVTAAIHWHALQLWLKGVRLRPRPRPPASPVTISNAEV
jgi:DUF1365 family protein